MRAIRLSFLHMLKLIRHDMMLFAAGLAPLLAGVAIRFGVPFLEKMLVSYTGAEAVLTPYYSSFTAGVSAFCAVCRRDCFAGSDGNPAGDHHSAADRRFIFQ